MKKRLMTVVGAAMLTAAIVPGTVAAEGVDAIVNGWYCYNDGDEILYILAYPPTEIGDVMPLAIPAPKVYGGPCRPLHGPSFDWVEPG